MGKLKERMEADLRLRNLRPSTQASYLRCVRALAKHYMRSPATLSEEEVRGFVLYLQDEKQMTPSTLNVYISALLDTSHESRHRPETHLTPWPGVDFPIATRHSIHPPKVALRGSVQRRIWEVTLGGRRVSLAR